MRALLAGAALLALSACGGILGPTQPDLERAVAEFYVRGEHPAAPPLANAHITSFEGCQPINGTFRCPVVFSTEQGNVATLIWIVRTPSGGWDVRNIALN